MLSAEVLQNPKFSLIYLTHIILLSYPVMMDPGGWVCVLQSVFGGENSMGLDHWKCSYQTLVFFSIFDKSGNNTARWNDWRLYNHYNHCPCARPLRPAHVGEPGPPSWPLARLQVLQNNGPWFYVHVSMWKHCRHEIAISKIQVELKKS